MIDDRIGRLCIDRITPLLTSKTQNGVMKQKLPAALTVHIALRSRKYDFYAKRFIEENPDSLVVSIGSGFDTRYWRVSGKPWRYIEVDLPEVVRAKREVLGDLIDYEMIGCSVLDEEWITRVASMQKTRVLFIAEGLFMYLPKEEVARLFARLSETFSESRIVFETVNERATKGRWKRIVERKMNRRLGSTAGSSFVSGLRKATDIEAYGKNIRVVGEWSYFEDKDVRPRILKLFRYSKFLSKFQWTVEASLN